MSNKIDLYNNTYGKFKENVLAKIRGETYGEDIGQNSWITAEEYDRFYSWLGLETDSHLLEIASGSGGPALYLSGKFGCQITGVDINEEGLATAKQAAINANLQDANFLLADMDKPLAFERDTFDAIMCIDSINHFRNRLAVLKEWYRVLKPGKRVLFTDSVVLTGPVSNEELATRSNIGFFLFVPLDLTKDFIREAGFTLQKVEDVTPNIVLTSGRWYSARQNYRDELLTIEGEERFEGLQRFLKAVHTLTSEKRMSRFVFVAEK
jgi:cyclopropane fatty-acyl-phospholipid synthase-like methyltransferase